MDIIEAIKTRRSGRAYTDRPVDEKTLRELIRLGTLAATGSHLQPWGFAVIQDRDELRALSASTKKTLLADLENKYSMFAPYRDWLEEPTFNIFYNAPTLLLVYGDTASYWFKYDCSMCVGNIMLAAHSMDIGTCWIGFAHHALNTPEFKKAHNVPEDRELVATLAMGYYRSNHKGGSADRREAEIYSWKKPD